MNPGIVKMSEYAVNVGTKPDSRILRSAAIGDVFGPAPNCDGVVVPVRSAPVTSIWIGVPGPPGWVHAHVPESAADFATVAFELIPTVPHGIWRFTMAFGPHALGTVLPSTLTGKSARRAFGPRPDTSSSKDTVPVTFSAPRPVPPTSSVIGHSITTPASPVFGFTLRCKKLDTPLTSSALTRSTFGADVTVIVSGPPVAVAALSDNTLTDTSKVSPSRRVEPTWMNGRITPFWPSARSPRRQVRVRPSGDTFDPAWQVFGRRFDTHDRPDADGSVDTTRTLVSGASLTDHSKRMRTVSWVRTRKFVAEESCPGVSSASNGAVPSASTYWRTASVGVPAAAAGSAGENGNMPATRPTSNNNPSDKRAVTDERFIS